jgi:hypothetical protein
LSLWVGIGCGIQSKEKTVQIIWLLLLH